jgi:deoxyribose-phosphate aldolase
VRCHLRVSFLVKVAKKALGDSGVKVASVSTAFPSGQAPKSVKIADTRFAVNEGADEIDMVISRGHFHSGDYNFVFDEIAAIKEACGDARLKVILETGELGTYDKVRLASDIAIAAGADFIKTSTGKINPAATMEVTLVMLHAIRDHYLKTGEMIAMKPAGGIRKSKEALHYLMMVKEELGEEWLSNHWFRFGASSLANDILMQLQKEADGHYQSADYFSEGAAFRCRSPLTTVQSLKPGDHVGYAPGKFPGAKVAAAGQFAHRARPGRSISFAVAACSPG